MIDGKDLAEIIQFQDVIEFEIDDQDFIIRYLVDEKLWIAMSFDDEQFPDDIIISEFEKEIELFNGYILTKEKFNDMVDIVNESLLNLNNPESFN